LVLDHFEFLDHVVLPALTHLGVRAWSPEGSRTGLSSIRRSQCTLTRLTLLNGYIPRDVWSALLPVAETVHTLDLFNTTN
jgi:hypothetical protein